MTRIGIMSFAHMHAHSYAACINMLPGAELAAIWDADARRGRKMAKEFESSFVKDLEKFLDTEMEGVIVTAENVNHRVLVEAAAEAGLWVLCEKPLAPTVEDAAAMVTTCKKAGIGLGTAFPCRYAQPLMAVKDMLDSGNYGDVYAVSCTNHGQSPGGWFADEELSGGGATMDHTVHVVDLLRWMLGKEFKRVYCELGNQLHKDTLDTDDLGSLHLEMEGGIQVSHVASWSRPKTFPTWGDVTMEFICEGGVINTDAFNQKLMVYDDNAKSASWAPWGDNPDLGLVQDFVEAVRDKRFPTITGVDGLRATEVTVAAYDAYKNRKTVTL